MTPKISIVVPVYNEEKRIHKCLLSLLTQNFTDFEVIIVNDGSAFEDKSQQIIEDFCEDPRFRFIVTENHGTGSALNTGFSMARGTYFTWVSADSWVYKDFLKELNKALDENPDKVMAYSDWAIYDELNGNKLIEYESPEFSKKDLQIHCNIGPCWLFRRAAKEKAGPYITGICEDYYMHLMLSGIGDFIRVPKSLGVWRNHKENLTNKVSNPSGWYLSSVAKAKARWNQAKYRVAYLCPTLDAASVGWGLMTCFNDLSDKFAVHHILGDETHVTPGVDTRLFTKENDPTITKDAVKILTEADIVHINNHYPDCDVRVWNIIKNKKLVIHLHASQQQWDKQRIKYWQAKGVQVLTCTPGHTLCRWVPNFIPISEGLNLTNEHYYSPTERNDSKLRLICHHNYLSGKGILQLKDAIMNLDETYFKGRLTDKLDWSISGDLKMKLFDHLLIKKNFDICIDTITHGYCGMAAWEAMSQAMAVICRMDELTLKEYKEFFGSIPPILNVRLLEDVIDHLFTLIDTPHLARELGQRGREWMLKNYTAEKILSFYEDLYTEIINTKDAYSKMLNKAVMHRRLPQ